jgi:hypothetical protein
MASEIVTFKISQKWEIYAQNITMLRDIKKKINGNTTLVHIWEDLITKCQ